MHENLEFGVFLSGLLLISGRGHLKGKHIMYNNKTSIYNMLVQPHSVYSMPESSFSGTPLRVT